MAAVSRHLGATIQFTTSQRAIISPLARRFVVSTAVMMYYLLLCNVCYSCNFRWTYTSCLYWGHWLLKYDFPNRNVSDLLHCCTIMVFDKRWDGRCVWGCLNYKDEKWTEQHYVWKEYVFLWVNLWTTILFGAILTSVRVDATLNTYQSITMLWTFWTLIFYPQRNFQFQNICCQALSDKTPSCNLWRAGTSVKILFCLFPSKQIRSCSCPLWFSSLLLLLVLFLMIFLQEKFLREQSAPFQVTSH